ncbi:MAG: hypothetical protein Q8K99_13575 [Actinomycetota bacterium]|nr:hypothetical protein [Actinomycetota bacterium]
MRRIALLALLALAAVGLVACSSADEADEGTEMGVWGYVASAENAKLELAAGQPGATSLTIDRVVAPEDAWIVVHIDEDGMPGERVGLAGVEKGETTSLEVPFDTDAASVIVAVHADRGEKGEFDFDMEAKETSPDRPFFVDAEELARVVTVR